MIRRTRMAGAAVVSALALSLFPAGPLVHQAGATFPGANGKIAYNSDFDGDNEIYVVPSVGGASVQLTHNLLEDEDAAFSPNGNLIFWDQELPSGKRVIMSMKTDGTSQKQLTPSTKDSWDPTAGPSGDIVFAREISGSSDIFMMNANGSGVQQITDTGRFEDEPTFSPTGRLIAFTRSYHFFSAIFTMKADGSAKQAITPADAAITTLRSVPTVPASPSSRI